MVAVFSNQDDYFSVDNDDESSDITMTQTSRVWGSAFVIDSNGYILTNKHVLEDNSSYFVALHDGTDAKIDKIWFHPTMDLAIAHIDTKRRLPTLLIADTTKTIGDDVFTLWTPFSQYINTLSVWVISAVNRTLNLDGGKTYTGLYQLDMEINPWNSGWPLFDRDGQVFGIVTAKTMQSNHLWFAIPLSDTIVSQFLMDVKSNTIKSK